MRVVGRLVLVLALLAGTVTVTAAHESDSDRFSFAALGIYQSVYPFPCSRAKAPGNVVYRWGCAGENNVYLLAHNYGKFYPLYRAYYAGKLTRGLIATYVDGKGKAHRFRLAWYRVVAPDGDVGFAYAALSRSSLTLQTCVRNNRRLVVRFVEVLP